jgi:hypothetical protein
MTRKEFEELKRLEGKGYFTCFRTGVWTDSEGKTHDITQGDLANIANQFNKKPEVPLFIEHPEKASEPEQGKIQSLIQFGDYLLAKAKEVKTDLIDKIKKGLYQFVSIAFNPEFELQHIGVTNQPAVDGLMPIKDAFASFSKGNIVYHFETKKLFPGEKDVSDMKIWLFDNWLKDLIAFTNKFKDKNKEEPMKDEEGTEVPETKPEDQTAKFQKQLTEEKKRADDAEQRAITAEQKVVEIEDQNRKNTVATFTQTLLENKKLYPNEVEPMTEFLLKQDYQKTYQFSKVIGPQTSLEFIQRFLENLPDRLPLDKIQEPAKKTGQDNACFSRIKPDDENLDLHYRAKTLMDKEEISYEEALARLEDVN